MASRYQTFRRIVAPIAILAAIALLARESCQTEAHEEVRFALDLGEAAPRVREVRVDLFAGGEPVGFFETRFGAQGATRTPRWRQVIPGGEVEAAISLTLAGGEVVELRRRVHAPPGGEVVIPAAPPPPQ